MEISRGLQEEIKQVQSGLKNAIRDHQICVGRLKDDPNNTEILGQIQEIQLHIISLGRCQKQAVQRLRQEVEQFQAANTNGAKVSIASLLGLNNNNNITNNNETKANNLGSNNLNGLSRRSSKDDYEEAIRNSDLPSPLEDSQDNVTKDRSSSVETVSGEDEVVEVSLDENSVEKTDANQNCELESTEQLDFLGTLGLITTEKNTELENKRAERKRRSTANPQFVYSNWEIPTKRRRYSYLQNGSAPQTRQTTARLNGPSPPPNKVSPPKSSTPPSRASIKSLIPTQKSTTRPNILRNVPESKVFASKNKLDNGAVQVPSAKSVQSVGNKAVHIPGLPSSLTIERIESDSAVCIHCRNPGTLAICEKCVANYHVSCHTVSPAPPRTCPKCAAKTRERDREREDEVHCKQEEEIEEKEKERYDLRERNSDLRLQVYELEKSSQLLGQSLQLQHRTRQDLLGKQEKTQRSIKRLVDFIKLMQPKKDPSPPPLASTSFQIPISSSPPSQTPMSANRKSSTPPSPLVVNQIVACPSPQFAQIRSPKYPTSIKCPAPVPDPKKMNHISSSKKSQNQPPSLRELTACPLQPLSATDQKARLLLPLTISCPPQATATFTSSQNPMSLVLPSSSTSCPIQPIATVKNRSTVSPLLTVAAIQRPTAQIQPPSTSCMQQQRSTALNQKASKRALNTSSTRCDPEGNRTHSFASTISSNRRTSNGQTSQNSQVKQKPSSCPPSPLRITNQNPIYSTHCSQAITSPISSPVISTNHKVPQMIKTSTKCLKTVNRIMNQPTHPSNLSHPPAPTSPNT